MSIPRSSTTSRLLSAGIAAGVVAAVIVGVQTPASAAAAPVTLSTANGPSAGGNTITATSTTAAAFLTGVTAPVTTFSLATCVTTYTSAASTPVTPTSATVGNVVAATTNKVSNVKATILVPALLVMPTTAASLTYKVCVYRSATADEPLVGTATYTVAASPTIAASGAVVPATGPALGGTTITVVGTGFPTTAGSISGTLGGSPLTSVTPISSTGFTAVAPPHAPGLVTLAVTTTAGTVTKTNAYDYSNGIVISPNTAPNTTAANPIYVDVLGAGFLNYTFGLAETNARVWLVDGDYDPGPTNAANYIRGPVAECVTPVVIADNELICSMNLFTGGLTHTTGASAGANPANIVPDGTYTMTVVNDSSDLAIEDATTIASGAFLQSDVSSGSTFTVSPY